MAYNLFISHSWSYADAYESLIRLLDNASYFTYKNYSVPKDNPIHNAPNSSLLREAIRRQMQPASCILILAGVYSTYSKWINIEMALAKEMGKRIVAIEPWGAQRTSMSVITAADVIVGWNTISVVNAIRNN